MLHQIVPHSRVYSILRNINTIFINSLQEVVIDCCCLSRKFWIILTLKTLKHSTNDVVARELDILMFHYIFCHSTIHAVICDTDIEIELYFLIVVNLVDHIE